MLVETAAIFLESSGEKSSVTLRWNAFDLSIQDRNYLYTSLKFEVGGSNNSLLFIHLENNQSIYLNWDSKTIKDLSQIEALRSHLLPFVQSRRKSQTTEIFGITLILFAIGSLIYFRAPIAGSVSKLIPVNLEKKIGDKVFTKRDGDVYKYEKLAEEKLIRLVQEINEYKSEKYTVHLSSGREMNAYATIGGHIFINKGLIKSLKSPEDLLGVVGHEMIHAKNRHVIKSLFQSLGLFALFQVLVGDITGLAAVLVDGGGPLLNLSYSRDLETEADTDSVELLMASGINPIGLTRALSAIDSETKKVISETPGAEKMNDLMSQTFLRSHPQPNDRNKVIMAEIDRLKQNEKYQNLKYKDLTKPWSELQIAMSQL